jgi:hypothetical protein
MVFDVVTVILALSNHQDKSSNTPYFGQVGHDIFEKHWDHGPLCEKRTKVFCHGNITLWNKILTIRMIVTHILIHVLCCGECKTLHGPCHTPKHWNRNQLMFLFHIHLSFLKLMSTLKVLFSTFPQL